MTVVADTNTLELPTKVTSRGGRAGWANPKGWEGDTQAFFNWVLCWLVLPNLPFLPSTLAGGPSRGFAIMLCCLTGLIARRMNYPLRIFMFVALMTALTIMFIASMFNMAPSMILSVVGLVFQIDPKASTEYTIGAVVIALVGAAALWLLRKNQQFEKPKWLFASIALAAVLIWGDYTLAKDNLGSYSRGHAGDAPFSSASLQTDFASMADGKTNLMIVMVESMGEPQGPAMKSKLDSIWLRPELSDRYEMTHGTTPYFGSTTNGEMRELCGFWGSYGDIDGPMDDCLPAILSRRGYETSSYHTFTGTFFDRLDWYPQIGFQNMNFLEDLSSSDLASCPTVFVAACDRDLPPVLTQRLKSANGPQFIYWLTVNSHLPVVRTAELNTEECSTLDERSNAEYPMVCRLFTIWNDTADALMQELARDDFPPTDILIVGDHMPPFTQQSSRVQFAPDRVPWYLLKHRPKDQVASD